MLVVEEGLELLGTFVMPLGVDRSPDSEALPEHLDAEATVVTAYKLVHGGDDDEHDAGYRPEEVGNLSFHISWSFWSLFIHQPIDKNCKNSPHCRYKHRD